MNVDDLKPFLSFDGFFEIIRKKTPYCCLVATLIIINIVVIPILGVAAADGQRFKIVDQHARQAPAGKESSVVKLAAYLTAPAQNEIEKARAIFTWMATHITYDVKAYKSKRNGDLSPEAVLKSKKAVCSGYANLFAALAKAAGLETVSITGYSKGYSYEAGIRFRETNHAWNAVKLNGKWHLLDTTWGAGYLDERGRFVAMFRDHFFMTPPAVFIYDHFPLQAKWQLLKPPISLGRFQEFVYVKPAFFHNGLVIKSHSQNTITTGDALAVTLTAPPETLLMASLYKSKERIDKPYTFVQRQGRDYIINAVFPKPGSYTLRIFAKNKNDNGRYAWALDYKIIARDGKNEPCGFPKLFAGFNENDVYLYGPLHGNLKAGSQRIFKLRSPDAVRIAVKIGNNWYDLTKQQDLFSGPVPIEKGTVMVMAKYSDAEQYRGLLQYNGY